MLPSIDPRMLFPLLMLVAFVAGGVIAARRMRTGWSPRRNQKMQRLLFYYALVMLGVFTIVQFYSGQRLWTFYLFWGIFIVLTGWQAFRRPTEPELLKTFAMEPGRCSRCGYDLTGNTSGVCPECGWGVPAAPPRVEDSAWAFWWQNWTIDYLENWRKTRATMIGIALMFTVTGGVLLYVRPTPFAVLALVMGAHFAINAVRVHAYGRRQSGP